MLRKVLSNLRHIESDRKETFEDIALFFSYVINSVCQLLIANFITCLTVVYKLLNFCSTLVSLTNRWQSILIVNIKETTIVLLTSVSSTQHNTVQQLLFRISGLFQPSVNRFCSVLLLLACYTFLFVLPVCFNQTLKRV